MKSGAARGKPRRFALCIENRGYPASLEIRKVYEVLADSKSAGLGLVRVIDESEEDYLFPAKYFVAIEIPSKASRLFVRSA